MQEESLSTKQLRNYKIQFILVTANEFEKEALQNQIKPISPNCITTYTDKTGRYRIGYLGSYLIAHLHLLQQGSQREHAAITSINEAYQTISPLCVIMVGIAFGRSSITQNLGDVLVSQTIKPYNHVRRSAGDNGECITEDRNHPLTPGHTILHLAQSRADQVNAMPLKYKVHVGTILTGEELIDDKIYKEKLIEAFSTADQDIIGGEMEAVGLASAMLYHSNINWLVIKAISDWADGAKNKNKTKYQKEAAQNAVDFCVKLFNTDRLCMLSNFVKTKSNYNEKYNTFLINGYKLYYLRNKLCCTFKDISIKTAIPQAEIEQLENFKIIDGKPVFHTISSKKAHKIRKLLGCGEELFEETYTDHEQSFFKNKKHALFCPPERAKAVIFDFDGTLTLKDQHLSTWQRIWQYLGYDLKICETLHRKFTNGDISHNEWCDKTAKYFIDRDLKKDDIMKIAQQITLMPGTDAVLQELSNQNIPVYICSGSIDIIIESVLGDSKKLIRKIVSNEFAYDKTGTKLKTITSTVYDFAGKSDFIKEVAAELNIDTSDILFVGNSNNDEFAVSSGAKTLVINPKLTDGYNRNIWKYFVGHNIKDLHEILPFLLPDKYLLERTE